MDRNETSNKIEYIICCVGAFAKKYRLSNAQAYSYLNRYEGIDFLYDCYGAEHTLSIDDAVSDIQMLCYNNGGQII